MFQYQPSQDIQCSYHRHCINPIYCPYNQGLQNQYEDLPYYPRHTIPEPQFVYPRNVHLSKVPEQIPSQYYTVPEPQGPRNGHASRVPEPTPYVSVKRNEPKKKKVKKCHCQCTQSSPKVSPKVSASIFSTCVPTAFSPSPLSYEQLLPSLSDYAYHWILHVLSHYELNTFEQNQKFAAAICEYFKFTIPQQSSISSLLQEIAERTKVVKPDTNNVNIKTETTPDVTEKSTKSTQVMLDAVEKIANQSGDPRINQIANVVKEAIKIGSESQNNEGLARPFIDLFMKGFTDGLQTEIKPTTNNVTTDNVKLSKIDSVAKADEVLNEYIQKSSIIDSMNEERINKALEAMD
jgi:hypothetical protein